MGNLSCCNSLASNRGILDAQLGVSDGGCRKMGPVVSSMSASCNSPKISLPYLQTDRSKSVLVTPQQMYDSKQAVLEPQLDKSNSYWKLKRTQLVVHVILMSKGWSHTPNTLPQQQRWHCTFGPLTTAARTACTSRQSLGPEGLLALASKGTMAVSIDHWAGQLFVTYALICDIMEAVIIIIMMVLTTEW